MTLNRNETLVSEHEGESLSLPMSSLNGKEINRSNLLYSLLRFGYGLSNLQMLVVLIAVQLLYWPLNHPRAIVHSLALPIDHRIPLLPIFVVPYVLYFPFWFATIGFFFRRGNSFKPVSFAFLGTWLCSYTTYILFQTKIERLPLPEETPLLKAIAAIYQWDNPYNCFPSLHTANAIICALAFKEFAPRYFPTALPCALSVVFSTVFIKQHYVLDAVGGTLLAMLVCTVTFRWWRHHLGTFVS